MPIPKSVYAGFRIYTQSKGVGWGISRYKY